jgi:hypothetical protein
VLATGPFRDAVRGSVPEAIFAEHGKVFGERKAYRLTGS